MLGLRHEVRWAIGSVVLLAMLMAPVTGCDALMDDILNPNFLAGLGGTTRSLPEPQSSVVVMIVNETGYLIDIPISATYQSGTVEPGIYQGLWAQTISTVAYECGVTEFVVGSATVRTPDGDEAADFPGEPLNDGVEFRCGAVIKVFVYPVIDPVTGDLTYEVSTETTLE